MERARRSGVRRWPELRAGTPRSELTPRRAVRARRSDGKRTVVERQSDRIVESLQRADGCKRARIHRDLRRRALLLWSAQVMTPCLHPTTVASAFARSASADRRSLGGGWLG